MEDEPTPEQQAQLDMYIRATSKHNVATYRTLVTVHPTPEQRAGYEAALAGAFGPWRSTHRPGEITRIIDTIFAAGQESIVNRVCEQIAHAEANSHHMAPGWPFGDVVPAVRIDYLRAAIEP